MGDPPGNIPYKARLPSYPWNSQGHNGGTFHYFSVFELVTSLPHGDMVFTCGIVRDDHSSVV